MRILCVDKYSVGYCSLTFADPDVFGVSASLDKMFKDTRYYPVDSDGQLYFNFYWS